MLRTDEVDEDMICYHSKPGDWQPVPRHSMGNRGMILKDQGTVAGNKYLTDNYKHENIIQFWLAEKGVQNV